MGNFDLADHVSHTGVNAGEPLANAGLPKTVFQRTLSPVNVLAIIVNYRHAEMTISAVRGLLPELEGIDARVVLVDNGSNDGSLEKMTSAVATEGWSDRVEVIESGKNGGFGFGVNRGFRHGLLRADRPRYFYLLNPDAIPDPGAVRALVDFLDARSDVGIAGGQTRDGEGQPVPSAFRFPTFLSELEEGFQLGLASKLLASWRVPLPIPTETQRVDWASAQNMLIRREVIEATGGFDETFFLYYEEVDLCRRALQAGWPTYAVKGSAVVHLSAAVTGAGDLKRRTPLYLLASRRYFFLKTYGRGHLWLANAAFVLGFSSWRVRRRIQGKPDPDRPHALYDFLRYNLGSRADDETERKSMVDFVNSFLADQESGPRAH